MRPFPTALVTTLWSHLALNQIAAGDAFPCRPMASRKRGRHHTVAQPGTFRASSDAEVGSDAPSDDAAPFHHVLESIDRIFCLSDLHTDHADNLEWLRHRMAERTWTDRDLLLVAGDISHDVDVFIESLQCLRQQAAPCQVFFVWGNHEAWLSREDTFDSLVKIERVYDTCRKLGVQVDPCLVAGPFPVLILPIQSWYDGSLCFSEELCENFHLWPWVDFLRCRWPDDFAPSQATTEVSRIPHGLVEHLLERNKAQFQLLSEYPMADLVTVSHFLPNPQSLPDWLDLNSDEFSLSWLDHGAGDMSAKFSKVAGSALIDRQLRSLPLFRVAHGTGAAAAGTSDRRRHIHVFGHSHRPKDFEYRGIRYIHNPLGKPRERQLQMIDPNVDFQLIWDTGLGEVAGRQVLRYWDEQGGGREALQRRLTQVRPGRYQRRQGRDPI